MPYLVLVKGPHPQNVIPIPSGSTVLGRRPDSDIVLNSAFIGTRAAKIEHTPPVTLISDVCGCRVVVDGTEVPRGCSVPLEDGAEVQIGPYRFKYSTSDPAVSPDQGHGEP